MRAAGHAAVGLDILPGPFTDEIGSIADRARVARCVQGVDAVLHAATLHKPHVATHAREAFVETNVTGTLVLLEEAARAGVRAFVMTSTTSAFGDALKPPPGAAAAWIDERVAPVPKNIYGVTKTAAEDLCRLVPSQRGAGVRRAEDLALLSGGRRRSGDARGLRRRQPRRRTNICSAASRSRTSSMRILLAAERAPAIGFGKYIISATTPFLPEDCARLSADAAAVVRLRAPGWEAEYARRGWRMFPSIDRVYDNALARARPRLAAEMGFRRHGRAPARNRRHPRAAREADRREGLPCRAFRSPYPVARRRT